MPVSCSPRSHLQVLRSARAQQLHAEGWEGHELECVLPSLLHRALPLSWSNSWTGAGTGFLCVPQIL